MEDNLPQNPLPPVPPSIVRNDNVWGTVIKSIASAALAGAVTSFGGYLGFWRVNKWMLDIVNPQLLPHLKSICFQNNTLLFKLPTYLFHEAAFTAAQLGSFEYLTRRWEAANGGKPLTLFQEACCGLTSGAIGAYIVGSPLSTIWFTPINANSNARNLYREVMQDVTNSRLIVFYKGTTPSEIIALNVGMLTSYKRTSSYLNQSLGFSEGSTRIGAAFVSAFFGSACSLPFVNVNRRMMVPDASGEKYLYTSFLECARKSFKAEGPSFFFKGFFYHFGRVTPGVMGLWMVLEQIRNPIWI